MTGFGGIARLVFLRARAHRLLLAAALLTVLLTTAVLATLTAYSGAIGDAALRHSLQDPRNAADTALVVKADVPAEERTAAFAAQFSLSHGCWLLTYPLAGWLGAEAGLQAAVLALGGIALAASLLAVRLWRKPVSVEHEHTDLHDGHPHLTNATWGRAGWRHSHGSVADELHPV